MKNKNFKLHTQFDYVGYYVFFWLFYPWLFLVSVAWSGHTICAD